MKFFSSLFALLIGLFVGLPCVFAQTVPTLSWEELVLTPGQEQTIPKEPRSLFGFVVPLERDGNNNLTEFLLVPYYGACIHVPPPPPDQIVHVTLAEAAEDIATMDTVWVTGVFTLDRSDGTSSYMVANARLTKSETVSWTQKVKALLLTLVCGGSVALGFVGPIAGRRLREDMAGLWLSIASGMLLALGGTALAVTFSRQTGLFFAMGFSLVVLLEKLASILRSSPDSKHNGVSIACGLAIHNYPECFLVCSLFFADNVMGLFLAIAMLAHNIPLGISLGLGGGAIPQHRRLCACIAGLLPPLAAIATYLGLRASIETAQMQALMCGGGGVLVALALFDLIPHAKALCSTKKLVLGVFLGMVFVGGCMGILAAIIR